VHDLFKNGKKDKPTLDILVNQINRVHGFIFCNSNLDFVADLIATNYKQSTGYNGYISDIDVIIPEGQTQIDIKQTNFFQKQNIPTKVNKKIHIEKEVSLIKVGEPVNKTHLKIIDLLDIRPFSFKINIVSV